MGAELVVDLRVSLGDFRVEVAFEAERGRPVALIGPNGAGKTTVLRALAGAPGAVSGRVEVGGRVWVDGADGVALAPEERRVGYLPQGFGLFPHLSARENVAYGVRGATSDPRVRTLIADLGVEAVADRRPGALSGGEQQRVALARALAADPALLLLDEPTASLDVGSRRAIRTLLATLFADRLAVVVTHDLRDLLAWDPLVLLIDEGRVVERGCVDFLRDRPHPFLEELLQPLARG